MRPAEKTDGELLREFVEQTSQSAFEVLFERHGRMVYNVCYRVLNNREDAQDATQATFLTLTSKSSSLLRRSCVAGWLHLVATNVSRNAVRGRERRRVREGVAAEMADVEADAQEQWQEMRDIVDDALTALPARYREPIVLFHLQNHSLEETAERLQSSPGTVGSRLSRGRGMLRQRLASKGIVVTTVTLASVLSKNSAAAAVPVGLASETCNLAAQLAQGKALSSVASASTVALTEGALKMLITQHIRTCTLIGFLTIGCLVAAVAANVALNRPATVVVQDADLRTSQASINPLLADLAIADTDDVQPQEEPPPEPELDQWGNPVRTPQAKPKALHAAALLGTRATNSIDLLARTRLADGVVEGEWEQAGAGVRTTANPRSRLRLAAEPPANYDVELAFTRTAGNEAIALILPVGRRQAVINLSGWEGQIHGLATVNGKLANSNETTVRPGRLENGKRYTLAVSVRANDGEAQVLAKLDGKALIDWSGPNNALNLSGVWSIDSARSLGLGAMRSSVTFHSLKAWPLRMDQ